MTNYSLWAKFLTSDNDGALMRFVVFIATVQIHLDSTAVLA